ncbi:MAG TPA: PEP-CTERM sorting domain-containing protein [Rheinheimera sp.]|nr:PEP-CTERM sorting domain-containing protein [Rheinheimera sp.]
MHNRILSLGILASALLMSTAQAGLVQLEFNHTTTPYGQAAYIGVLKDLTLTQTNFLNYGEGFGYNDFRLDIRFSDFNHFQFNDSDGALWYNSDKPFQVNSTFSVDFDDDSNQEKFYQTAANRDFYRQETVAMLETRIPDGYVASLFNFHDRNNSLVSEPDKNLSDIAPMADPLGNHLAIALQGESYLRSEFDAGIFYNALIRSPFESFFLDTYQGMNVDLVNPTQAEVDQYVADNFISAINWSFVFTRSFKNLASENPGYYVDAKINFEYAASAKPFVQEIFNKETDRLLQVIEYIPKPLIYLDEANTSYEFVAAKPDAAASVPAPGTLLLSLFGLTALALRRRKTL